MSQTNSQAREGHAVECCQPDECGWCCEPIRFGQGFARRTTTIYTGDHEALKEYWSDYHHLPAAYENLQHGRPAGGWGGCLWHSEQ